MIAVLLHNVRSAHNVGSIFRTADAAGVSTIYLTGVTPAPVDRFGRARKDIAKVALGAERAVSWEKKRSAHAVVSALRGKGWRIVGVEQDARARDYRSLRSRTKTLFVFGNEVSGLPRSVRDACDVLIEIPMRGAVVRQAHHPQHTGRGKESLNVSVAAGIVLFLMRRGKYIALM